MLVTTNGTTIPNDIKIVFNDESYYLNSDKSNEWTYTFKKLNESITFHFESNGITSQPYTILIQNVPKVLDYELEIIYPKHTGKKSDKIFNTGNATVLEGSTIKWKFNTKNTDNIFMSYESELNEFIKDDSYFNYSKTITQNLQYSIQTSNIKFNNYESLNFNIDVIKDEYPSIKVLSKIDTLDNSKIYNLGKISDDYGFLDLNVYYKKSSENKYSKYQLPITKSNYHQFSFEFPGNLEIDKGAEYEFYFAVRDNDRVNNFKVSKSEVFSFNSLTDIEKENLLLDKQKDIIKNLEKSIDKIDSNQDKLKEFKEKNIQKSKLNWNEKNSLKDLLDKKLSQENLMKEFNKQLEENLDKFNNEKNDEFKELLKERLENQEEKIKENEKLLEELKELQDKLREEDLLKKLDEISKNSQSEERSLKQLVELTKKYYLSKKIEKLSEELNDLSKKQDDLSKSEENSKSKQDSLSKKFDELKKEMNDIKKENEELESPMDFDNQKELQDDISKDQQNASDDLNKQEKSKASKNQKKAAAKMKKMSEGLQSMMQMQSSEQMEEDEQMLKQILDNLLSYSFDQEGLINRLKNIDDSTSDLPNILVKQQTLKEHFKHVDDSLFALSLRNPRIGEVITEEITEVHFNIDKSLNTLSELQFYKTAAYQQYALTSSNNLANLLSDALNSMQNQMSMPSSGQGKPSDGKGFQLPDIIQKQEQILQQMKNGQKSKGEGEQKSEGKGKKGEEVENSKEKGDKGKNGESGKNGNNSKPGEGEQQSFDEMNSQELFTIYKKQQELKNQLLDIIKSNPETKSKFTNILKKFESIENDILEKGFHDDVVKKMENLKHQLFKLDKANYEQEQDSKRQSNTNKDEFNNNNIVPIEKIKEYFNEIEILNRQVLPLQPKYKQKVKDYFNSKDD